MFQRVLCTARCHHIFKLSRTIADLTGNEDIQSTHWKN
ncbi:MAG: hypothetical protein HOP27_13980 [Anaerolineales bacterium]|nr:hypothetical protein [Anaerolineales bacterium]